MVLASYCSYILMFGFTVFVMNCIQGTALIDTTSPPTTNATNSTEPIVSNTCGESNFRRSFALAHQTISTIGYGVLAPRSDAVHLAVFVFGIFGLIFCSLLVAIIWSRVTSVRPVLAFSNQAVISKWNGKLALRFRIAGLWRPKPILTGHATVNAVLSGEDETGLTIARLVNLPLFIDYNPLMVLPWTVVHVIDDESPLYGCNENNWSERVHLITTVFRGMDSCTGNEISAMFCYSHTKVVWDHRFATAIAVNPNSGLITVKMNKFHELRPTLTFYLLSLQKIFFKKLKVLITRKKQRKRLDSKLSRSSQESEYYTNVIIGAGVNDGEKGASVEMTDGGGRASV
jgi:inward rectifier potassium channel